MREPASREIPLMASVGLLLDQAVISAGVVRRGEELTELVRKPLEELARVVRGAAELETAPLGIFQARALQSSSDLERLEVLEDTRPLATGVAWTTLQDQLEAVLSGNSTPEESASLRASLVVLAEASLVRSSAMVDWRLKAGDEWNDPEPNSSYVQL